MVSLLEYFDLKSHLEYQPKFENIFFSKLKLPNGTFKTTAARRMDDTFAFLSASLRRFADQSIDVLDLGISSGVSTCEMYEFLNELAIKPKILGIDLFINMDCKAKNRYQIVQRANTPLACQLGPFIINFSSGRLLRWSGIGLIKRFIFANLERRLRKVSPRKVQLLTRRLKQYNDDIDTLEHDLFQISKLSRKFDFIRAANVLNSSYFSDDELQTAGNAVLDALRPGGLLFVTRTDNEGKNHGTLFKKIETKLVALQDLNSGFEKKKLFTSV